MLLPSTTPFRVFRVSFYVALICIAALVGLVIAWAFHWVSARALQQVLLVATPAILMLIALCAITGRIGYEDARDHAWRYCLRCGHSLAAAESLCPECGATHTPELLAEEWKSRLRRPLSRRRS